MNYRLYIRTFLISFVALGTMAADCNPVVYLAHRPVTFDGAGSELVNGDFGTFQQIARDRAISTRDDGEQVVVFDGGVQRGVYAQIVDDTGAATGAPIQIDDNTFGSPQPSPAVDHLSDGGFVAAWTNSGSFDSGYGAFFRVFDSNGAAVTGKLAVSSTIGVRLNLPENIDVASVGESGFVVVWNGGTTYNISNIYGQRFDNNGTKVGSEFLVNTYTGAASAEPVVDAAPDGSFVVAWSNGGYGDTGLDGAYAAIVAQRFSSGGAKTGNEFVVNTFTTYDQTNPALAVDGDGSFVVAWRSNYGDEGFAEYNGTEYFVQTDSIAMRRYDSAGTALGDEEHINTYTSGAQTRPAIAMDDDGSFVVVWESRSSYRSLDLRDDGDPNLSGLFGRCFDASGNGAADEFQLNTITTGAQVNASLSTDGSGNFLATWLDSSAETFEALAYKRSFVNQACDTSAPELALTVSDGGALWSTGSTIVYTLSVANSSGITQDVDLTARLPLGSTFDAASSDGGWSCSGRDCSTTLTDVAPGAPRDVDIAVEVEAEISSLWWLLNRATARFSGGGPVVEGLDVTPFDVCNGLSLDPTVCSVVCYIDPDLCGEGDSSLVRASLTSIVRSSVGYPELEIRDDVLSETRGGQRAIDLYYDQSANAAAAVESDPSVASAASNAAMALQPMFSALAEGTGDSMSLSQADVDAVLALTTALRDAAGPELAEVLDRELPRLDIDGWVGLSADDVVDEVDSLTCEGFETELFCGEINGDCQITATDALAVLRMAVGTLESVAEADVDGNGSVTATDALRTLQTAVGTASQSTDCNPG